MYRACDDMGKPEKLAGESAARESGGPLRDGAMTLLVNGGPAVVEPSNFQPVEGVSMGSAGCVRQANDQEPSMAPLAESSGGRRGTLASIGETVGPASHRRVISVSPRLRGEEVVSPVTPTKWSGNKGFL